MTHGRPQRDVVAQDRAADAASEHSQVQAGGLAARVLELQRGVGNTVVSGLVARAPVRHRPPRALLQRDLQLELPQIGRPLSDRRRPSLLGDQQLTLSLSKPRPFVIAPKTLASAVPLPEWITPREGGTGGGPPPTKEPAGGGSGDHGHLEAEAEVKPDLDPAPHNDPARRLDGMQYTLEIAASWNRADRSFPGRFRTALGQVHLLPAVGASVEIGLGPEHAVAAQMSLRALSLHLNRNWGEISVLVGAGKEGMKPGDSGSPAGEAGLEFERAGLKILATMKAKSTQHGVEFGFESVFAVGGHF